MSLHHEVAFEDGICIHLAAHGWLYEAGAATLYDRAHALFPEDLLAWVQATQPDAWDSLTKANGPAAGTVLADRLRAALDKQGTLEVLRYGLDVVGLTKRIALCQFRPALAMNEALQTRYAANRLRVVRQVRYSLHGENCLDVVLFINGIPVATVELKSHYTQRVQDAIDQYRYDRLPRSPSGNTPEPLLAFPGGALVHFAVSNSEVHMCTKLAGADSKFLPFNRGHDFGAGNPPNPNGAPTAYLWEDVWQRDGWLEILGRYLVPVKDDKKRLQSWIFPRFHQLDATRKLVAQVLADAPGGKYLIEHSAGSGKTNSIAWTAHFLADLHDAEHHKLFDTVLVVSDRTVLDKQLREAIESFERTPGVVAVITGDGGAKSGELAEALAAGKKIVVCTIQTFPYALEAVRELSASKGKRFAVIADEAHSSQTGQAAAELKIGADRRGTGGPGGRRRGQHRGPAGGEDGHPRRPGCRHQLRRLHRDPQGQDAGAVRPPARSDPAGGQGQPASRFPCLLHAAGDRGRLHPRRAEELHRLQDRIPLTHAGREIDEKEVDASAAKKGIMGWVRLHPHNIAARVEIVVEHFRQNVAHLLGGTAKAMVVTASRKEAVRWTLRDGTHTSTRQGYAIGLLVAFSGEVNDPESGPDAFTETNMNPGLRGRDIREAFGTPEFSILLVANKFQTGFDQPLLCAMYVDRKLGGIQAVQTLSRLNRAHPGKDTTYVVDFVNEPAKVLEAFRQYHTTAALADISDPNVVLDLRNKLEAVGFYDRFEVDRVAKVAINPKATQGDLDAAIGPPSSRLLTRFKTGPADVPWRAGRVQGAAGCHGRDGEPCCSSSTTWAAISASTSSLARCSTMGTQTSRSCTCSPRCCCHFSTTGGSGRVSICRP